MAGQGLGVEWRAFRCGLASAKKSGAGGVEP
jgi:hypothetical protein